MAINENVQYNGGFLPDTILLTQCYTTFGEPDFTHPSLQPTMIPPKGFDIFPPDWGMLRRSKYVHILLEGICSEKATRETGGEEGPHETLLKTNYFLFPQHFSP